MEIKHKQITLYVEVGEQYNYTTEGDAKVEINIPENLIDHLDFTHLVTTLVAEAMRSHREKMIAQERERQEKELAKRQETIEAEKKAAEESNQNGVFISGNGVEVFSPTA